MPHMVALAYNPNTQKTEAKKSCKFEFEDSLGHTVRPYLKNKMKT